MVGHGRARPSPLGSRSRWDRGFTLVELMVAVAIMGIMAGLAIPNYLDYLDKARIARAIAEIRGIARVVDAYTIAHNEPPPALTDVGAGHLVDPWGNAYAYFDIVAWAAGKPGGGGGGAGGKKTWLPLVPDEAYAAAGGVQMPRKDRFLHPINSDYDLYSMGKDGRTTEALTAKMSHDDIIRANDGGFVGLASQF